MKKKTKTENRWKIQIYYSLDELLPGQKVYFFIFVFLPVILFSCYSFVKTIRKPDRRRLLER